MPLISWNRTLFVWTNTLTRTVKRLYSTYHLACSGIVLNVYHNYTNKKKARRRTCQAHRTKCVARGTSTLFTSTTTRYILCVYVYIYIYMYTDIHTHCMTVYVVLCFSHDNFWGRTRMQYDGTRCAFCTPVDKVTRCSCLRRRKMSGRAPEGSWMLATQPCASEELSRFGGGVWRTTYRETAATAAKWKKMQPVCVQGPVRYMGAGAKCACFRGGARSYIECNKYALCASILYVSRFALRVMSARYDTASHWIERPRRPWKRPSSAD